MKGEPIEVPLHTVYRMVCFGYFSRYFLFVCNFIAFYFVFQ